VDAEESLLLSGLDALGHDGEIQNSAKRDNSVCDRLVLAIAGNLTHEGAVDLRTSIGNFFSRDIDE